MRFGILGPVAAWDGSVSLRIGGPREQKLLAVLLLNAGKSVPVSRLAAALWGADLPATAKAQVHNSIAALRRNLVTTAGDRVPIARLGAGFVIGIDDDQLDASRFGQQVAAAEHLIGSGSLANADELLQLALGLWRGPALGGIETGLLGAEARRLDEQRLTCLERHLHCQLELGRHADVADRLAGLAEEHPLRERFIELRMVALYRGGRRQDALSVFAETRQTLIEQTGLDPRPELLRLHQAILAGDRALDGARAQVAAPDHTRVRPSQLPADAAGFTGRMTELGELDRLLADRAAGRRPHAIATIVGPAGTGKTALAVHWAHRVAGQFPDGQLYVDLHGFGHEQPLTPLDALGRLLRALGQTDTAIATGLDERAAQFRTLLADRSLLVLLDNAASSEQVRPLLPGGRVPAVVITSRDRLDGLVVREGARQIPLGALPPHDAADLIRAATGPIEVDAQMVDLLAHLCDRLPLALRIASARLGAGDGYTPRMLVAELGDEHRRLTALSLGTGDAAVRTAFASSYESLSAPAARMLRALGVHDGPEPGIAVCAEIAELTPLAAQPVLAELVARHLVVLAGPDRYRMHDLIRLFARECADAQAPAETAAMRGRAVGYYLRTAYAADGVLRPSRALPFTPDPAPPPADDLSALAWFDSEAANVFATISATEKDLPEQCWRLASVAYAWLERRQRRSEWLETFRIGLRAATATGDLAAVAIMQQSLAIGLVYADCQDEATALFEQIVRTRRALGESRPLAASLMNLGNTYAEAGRDEEAIAHLTESLRLVENEVRDDRMRGVVLNNLGWAHYRSGRYDLAVGNYRDAAAIGRELANPQSVSFAEGNLAMVHAVSGRHSDALEHWQRSLRAARQAGDRRLEANSWAGVAKARLALGETAGARPQLQQALAIYLELGATADADEMRTLLAS